MERLTTADVRVTNRRRILHMIYRNRELSQQMLCDELDLSRPTVIPLIRELEEQGWIHKDGFFSSTGGRRAAAIRFAPEARIAVGVELVSDAYEICALNMYGETIAFSRYVHPFSHDETYYAQVCSDILSFVQKARLSSSQILGVGIVLQGLISSDGRCVTYGKILGCTGLQADIFERHLPWHCQFFHDAEAAAQDELWQSPSLNSAIYMNIRAQVSGAVIVDRQFLKGTLLKSGVFEHMTLIPGGRQCYCGQQGCVNAYCSTSDLLEEAGSLESFFRRLREGDPSCRRVWKQYLGFLASTINNLHMFLDYPVILGGALAAWLEGSDLTFLHQIVNQISAFPDTREFIRISRCPHSPICRGAALPLVSACLKELI